MIHDPYTLACQAYQRAKYRTPGHPFHVRDLFDESVWYPLDMGIRSQVGKSFYRLYKAGWVGRDSEGELYQVCSNPVPACDQDAAGFLPAEGEAAETRPRADYNQFIKELKDIVKPIPKPAAEEIYAELLRRARQLREGWDRIRHRDQKHS